MTAPMFAPGGPTFFELIHQALVSTRAGYDLLAPKFDLTPFRTPDDLIEPAIDCGAGILPAQAGSPHHNALDICCGTGAAMRFLKSRCARVVGIDFSPGMIRVAKEKVAEAPGNATVEFIEGDVLAMNFNAEFDLATCFGALGHILPRDQHTFLSNIRKALKPGGRFVFITADHPSFISPIALILRAFNAVMHIRNALLKPEFIMYYLTFLLPEVEPLLQSEGFSVEVKRHIFPAPFERYCVVIATRKC